MDTPDNASKRLVVYDRHDHKKWIALDLCNAQSWELEPHESDWDCLDGFHHRAHERTLYRLADKRWVLVERTVHFDLGEEWPKTFEVLTDAQAAEQLLLSGLMPPDDVVHHVSDKLTPPPIQQAVVEAPKVKETDKLAEAESYLEAVFGPPPVKKFGPVRDPYSNDETTIFQYPHNRWILFTDASYQAVGKRSKPVTASEATEWFLQNGLEVPQDLYQFLPVPDEHQTADTRPPETSEVSICQERPNGQKYGPVMDEWGNPTTLTYYFPCHWILFGSTDYGRQNWRRALLPGEAANWLLDNGFILPSVLIAYLPLPSESGAPQPELREETACLPSGQEQAPARRTSEDYEREARRYVTENRHREGTANPLTVRELAKAVGCSEGKACDLSAWREVMEDRKARGKPKAPKAVSLTSKLEATIGERDDTLERLIDEHKADYEPSPLEPDGDRPHRVKAHKQV